MAVLKASAELDAIGGVVTPFQFRQTDSIGFKPRKARIQVFWPEGFMSEAFPYGQISIGVSKSDTSGLVGTIIGESNSMSSIVQHSCSWRNDSAQVMTWEYWIDSKEAVYPGRLFLTSLVTNTANTYYYGVTLFGEYFTPSLSDIVKGLLQG